MDKNRRRNAQKVIVAMSGGVDSSVAAALLKKAGVDELRSSPRLANARVFDVVGVFMKFWSEPPSGFTRINTDRNTDLHRYENRCCTSEAEARARKVAKILKIPFYVFNFEKEFKKRIVDYFIKEEKRGLTPNPCVVCNKEIKFGLLLEKALALNADFIATGHYARKIQNPKGPVEGGRVEGGLESKIQKLLKAKDKNKDQSYFLWKLNQKQLKRTLFPIGNYTRKEVEELAKKFKLPFKGVRKSQEICFIPNTIEDFLRRHIKPRAGNIIDSQGKILGQHQGLYFYTIGQRKGIGLPGGPYYVLDKDLKKNVLIVTKNEKDLYKKELICEKVNWISPKQSLRDATGQAGKELKLPLKVKAKIRYRHQPASAKIYKIRNTRYKILFNKPQRAITPGQSVVFYKNQKLLGGGVIV